MLLSLSWSMQANDANVAATQRNVKGTHTAVSLISESPRIVTNRRIAANRGICTTFKLFSCVRYIKDGTCVRSTKFQIDISIVRAMN